MDLGDGDFIVGGIGQLFGKRHNAVSAKVFCLAQAQVCPLHSLLQSLVFAANNRPDTGLQANRNTIESEGQSFNLSSQAFGGTRRRLVS